VVTAVRPVGYHSDQHFHSLAVDSIIPAGITHRPDTTAVHRLATADLARNSTGRDFHFRTGLGNAKALSKRGN